MWWSKWNFKKKALMVPLKHLSNLWRLLEIPLLNWKEESKIKCEKYSVLAANAVYNADINSNNIIFTIKGTKWHVPVVTLSAKGNQKYQNFLLKNFWKTTILERTQKNIKQKMRLKTQKTSIDIFLNQTL